MSSNVAYGHYEETLGSDFEYLMSCDGTPAYSVSCGVDSYLATGSGQTLSFKTPIIASPGIYGIINNPPTAMVSKYCRVRLSDCSFNCDVNNISGAASSILRFWIILYIGDASNKDKIIYRYDGNIASNGLNVKIPDFKFVDVPAGKNIFLEVYATQASGTNGLAISFHAVSNIDD